jgi:hypothetical protein
MTLLRHSPRPVYRIYSEEEFFGSEDCCGEPEAVSAERSTAPRPWGRLAGLAALSVTFATLLGVFALDAMRSNPHRARRIALVPAPDGRPRKRRAPKVLPPEPRSLPLSSVVRNTRRRTRAPRIPKAAARAARVAKLPAYTPSPPSAVEAGPAATEAAPATPATTATVVSAKTAAAPHPPARPEFGFER